MEKSMIEHTLKTQCGEWRMKLASSTEVACCGVGVVGEAEAWDQGQIRLLARLPQWLNQRLWAAKISYCVSALGFFRQTGRYKTCRPHECPE